MPRFTPAELIKFALRIIQLAIDNLQTHDERVNVDRLLLQLHIGHPSWPTVGEALGRWTALAAFFKEHGHFLVTNGPYQLKSWSADHASLEAFRDLSYPLGVGSFDTYAIPRRGWLTGIARDGDRLALSADIETVNKFGRSYRLERRPIQSLAPDELKRAAPECRYVIFDGDGQAVLAGTVQPLSLMTRAEHQRQDARFWRQLGQNPRPGLRHRSSRNGADLILRGVFLCRRGRASSGAAGFKFDRSFMQ
jgi:hypothetical protein